MKLKMIGLLAALVFAAPVVAEAAPVGAMTAQSAAPMATPAVETNAAVDASGSAAKIENVWWRGGGWRGGWGGRRFGWGGYGWRGGWGGYRGFYGGYGWRRGWGWRRRWY